MKKLSLLIKPCSSRCNIDCRYCFYKDEDKLRADHSCSWMSLETAKNIIKYAIQDASQGIDFVFQGGEPTLRGLNFYREFVDIVQKQNDKKLLITYNIQTNGILFDEEWCSFLKENEFLVGISLDGPKAINDINRIGYDGTGTTEQTLRAIALLKKHKVNFNVLLVISNSNVHHAKECYEFMKRIGVEYLQLIPAINPLETNLTLSDSYVDLDCLSTFLCELFDVWYEDFLDANDVRVTYFENIIVKLMGQPVFLCSMNGLCTIENVIEANGNVYPCDFYCGDDYLLGNINETSFYNMIFSSKAVDFVSESANLNLNCQKCKYFGICLGCCKRYQLQNGSRYQNVYCKAYKAFFDYAYEKFAFLANVYKQMH